jgi:nucleoside-diphosphate-sugar epimerase
MAKVFLAGATGAIGKRLVPQLLDAGCEVFGTTRSERKVAALKTAGVTPIVVDVFDAPALSQAMTAVRPEIVINQLTDLPANLEPSGMTEGIARTTRIRIEGTRNLVAAALEAGVRRVIAWLVGSTRMGLNAILKMLRWISAPTHLPRSWGKAWPCSNT